MLFEFNSIPLVFSRRYRVKFVELNNEYRQELV